jgi:ferredoxin
MFFGIAFHLAAKYVTSDSIFMDDIALTEAHRFPIGKDLGIDKGLCLNLRGRGHYCEACVSACLPGALQLEDAGVVFDEAGCTGCGACLPACPAGAFSLSGFSPQAFLDAIADQREIHIHCSASRSQADGAFVPCHAVLDARLLAAAMGDKCTVFYFHGTDQCADCQKGNAITHLASQQARLQAWLGATLAPRIVVITQSPVSPDQPAQSNEQKLLSRRQFFRQVGSEMLSSAAALFAPGIAEQAVGGDAASFPGDLDPQRPSVYQALLAEHAGGLPWLEGGIPWQDRSVADSCNACGSCARLCPTGALHFQETESTAEITFDLGACTGCGLCDRICPMHALVLQPVTNVAALKLPRRVLRQFQQRHCSRCGDRVVSAANEILCAHCKNERALQEQWLGTLHQ